MSDNVITAAGGHEVNLAQGVITGNGQDEQVRSKLISYYRCFSYNVFNTTVMLWSPWRPLTLNDRCFTRILIRTHTRPFHLHVSHIVFGKPSLLGILSNLRFLFYFIFGLPHSYSVATTSFDLQVSPLIRRILLLL
jgi:hypothetical protein